MGLLATRQTPNMEDQVSLFVWVITLDLYGMEGPTSSISYRQNSFWDRVTTQAPPLRQSRDTFGGRVQLDRRIFLFLWRENTNMAQTALFCEP
jgi:hypothetical protein